MAKVGTSTGRGRAPGGGTFSWGKKKTGKTAAKSSKKSASTRGH